MVNEFEKIINQAETVEQNDALHESLKEQRWKKKKIGKISSSRLDELMKSGRGKSEVFGKQAIDLLIKIKGEIRTGESFDRDIDAWQMKWGRDNEPRALELLKQSLKKLPGYEGIIGGSEGVEIIFNLWGKYYGDSPDFEGYTVTGEIKCPVDRIKIEKQRDAIEFFTEAKNGKRSYHEYFWQMIGHLLCQPNALKCIYVVYDAYQDEIYTHELLRSSVHDEISEARERIEIAGEVLEMSKKNDWSNEPILNINKYLKERENE